MADDLVGTVVGALIGALSAGLVGLLAIWAQQRLQGKQWVRDNILGPVYDFARAVGEQSGAPQAGPVNPWQMVKWHDRMKVPRRLRESIQAFSDAHGRYYSTSTLYWNAEFKMQQDLVPGLTAALSKYLRNGRLPLAVLGIEDPPDLVLDVRGLCDRAYPFLLRHPDDPEKAWVEFGTSDVAHSFWLDRAVQVLQNKDPATLRTIHGLVNAHPLALRAREQLAASDQGLKVAQAKAAALADYLERKL